MTTQEGPKCPGCRSTEVEPLLTVERAPTSCGQLFSTRAAAIHAGDCNLQVTLCGSCGHIWNTAHKDEPGLLYNEDYYSSFTASSQAREYQTLLAEELNRAVRVEGKTVLEIGCGDGFFLKSLNSLGARAIGFEPSSTFRIAEKQNGIEVFHEHFSFDGSEKVSSTVDIVVMRHVLEHFASPGAVLESLRTSCFAQPGPEFIFLEVPNVFQLLTENLYFDFYNDHVQYFSYGSLTQMLGSVGWVPLARIGCDDEFLKLIFVNSNYLLQQSISTNENHHPEPKQSVISAAKRFRSNFDRWKTQLTEVVTVCREQGQHIAVWGAGSRGVALLSGSGLPGDFCDYVVDSDRHKHGKFLPMMHLPIYPPEQLRENPVDCVLVTSHTYFDEILTELGWFRSMGGKVIKVYPTPELV